MSAHNLKHRVAPAGLMDWNALTEAGAFCELCARLSVTLRVDPDGKLKATGNTQAIPYVADIAPATVAQSSRTCLACPCRKSQTIRIIKTSWRIANPST
jgi:hypothetical protein